MTRLIAALEKKRRRWTPSAAGIAMLHNVANGLPTTTGLRGRSEHGGAKWTERALHQHGLLDVRGVTAEGFAAIFRSRARSRRRP